MGKKHKKHHKSEKSEKISADEVTEKQTPLKLVLKVGGATPAATIPEPVNESMTSEFSGEGEKRHKHKKKKKKKSSDKEKHRHKDHSEEKHEKHKKDRKRTHEMMEEGDVLPVTPSASLVSGAAVPSGGAEGASPSIKRALVMDPEPFATPIAHTFREQKMEYGTSQLQACLEYIHKQLQRKDVNGFFSFPVTDNIAPGYSSIIIQPMDFSTMKTKIENHEYANVAEYKKDFQVMCNNCTTYNRPETVYFKEAKRLLSIGCKTMSKEKLIVMKKNLSFMATISNEELGLDDEEATLLMTGGATEQTPAKPKSKPKAKPKPSKFEAIPDDLTPEEILAAAKEAAKEASEELTLRRPKSKIGFLRRRPDGTTTLNILNPSNDGIVGKKERIVNLGQLTGKLTSGVGSLTGFKEDKRNKVNPVNYINYGPYSSFGPSYDSSFANVTKEDTDMLLSTYGDETGLQYALSLKSFVENAGGPTNLMVDSLLNVLTGSEHSKANQLLEQRKKEAEDMVRLAEEQKAAEETGKLTNENIDYDSLRTLSDDLGIDMSFLDTFEKTMRPVPKSEEEVRIDAKLQETSVLLRDLQKTQYERLSRKPPPHLAHVAKPSEKETKLAEKVTFELTQLAKQAMPSDLAPVAALRQAMGLTTEPTLEEVPGSDEDEDPEKDPAADTDDIQEVPAETPQEQSAENMPPPPSDLTGPPTELTSPSTELTDPEVTPTTSSAALEDAAAVADLVKDEPLEEDIQEMNPQEELRTRALPVNIVHPHVVVVRPGGPIPTTVTATATATVTSQVVPNVATEPEASPEVADDGGGGAGGGGDIEQDLAEFLQGGPLLPGVECDSPGLPAPGGLDPADLM